jgi:hypothetical protein
VKKDKKEKPIPVFREELVLRKEDWCPQRGMQESVLTSNADIIFCGGNRGGGKSIVLVLDSCYDIDNPNFGAMYFRKETGELEKAGGLYDKATKIYPLLGAKATKLKFVFPSGAYIMMDHLANEKESTIETRFKGLEIPAIYIDEIDQIMFNTFLKLMQSNRNSQGIRNRMIGSLNPNPDSWCRKFMDYYIDPDGFIDEERNGQVRYFFVYGTEVTDIIWGNSKEECYERAKNYIDDLWSDKFLKSGLTKYDLIKSFQFFRGDVAENEALLTNQPSYIANIAAGGAAAVARNLKGNWNIKSDGQEMVTRAQMDWMFDEHRTALRTGVKYLSIDVALLGLDNFVATLWDGNHIEDIFVKEKLDSGEAVAFVRSLMQENGVLEHHTAFDNIGNGQALTCFKRAIPINAQAAPVGVEIAYDNLKSQLCYAFGRMVIEGGITVSPQAANKLLPYGKGAKKERMTFKEILQNERRALMIADSVGKTKMYNKKQMKSILGHSPDVMESVIYKMIFNVSQRAVKKGFTGLENL